LTTLLLTAVLVALACHREAGETRPQVAQALKDLSTQAPGAVVGRIFFGQGTISRGTGAQPSGVRGAQVTLVDPASGHIAGTATTAADGSFRISAPAGAYLLKGGNTSRYIQIAPGMEVHADIQMPIP